MLKLLIVDFDGTLVTIDTLDFACSINGKEEESKKIHREFLCNRDLNNDTLERRISLLKGINIATLEKSLKENNFLRPGVRDLFQYLQRNNIMTVICSGNVMPILNYYANLLDIDYIIGTDIEVKDNCITGKIKGKIPPNFKKIKCSSLIEEYSINEDEIAILGDSISDIKMMELGIHRFFINPKDGVEKLVENSIIVDSIHDFLKIITTL